MAPSRATGALLTSLVALLALTLALAPAARADGWVTVRYTGTFDKSFVYELNDPSVWQSRMHFAWDEHETFHLTTPDRSAPEGPSVDVSGTVTSIYGPPNTGQDCSFSVAPRPRAPSPLSAGWSGTGPPGTCRPRCTRSTGRRSRRRSTHGSAGRPSRADSTPRAPPATAP